MVERFKKVVLQKNRRELPSQKALLYLRNLKVLQLIAVAVVGVSFYWIFVDRFSDSYNLSLPDKIGVVLQLLSSVYMFILARLTKNPGGMLVRISFLAYYAIIISGVAVLTLTRNLDILAENAISPYVGVSVSTYYLFLLVFMPLPSKLDSGLTLAFMYAGLILPDAVVRTSAYSLLSHIVLCACFTFAYAYFSYTLQKGTCHEAEINKLADRLLDFSYCDALTGILNRRAMDHYIEYLSDHSESHRIGVILFDIDYFKKYNDYYNHVNGDGALKQVAHAVENCLAGYDNAYLFRYGGEEFITIIDGADQETLNDTMKKICSGIWKAEIPRADIEDFDRITVTAGGSVEQIPNGSGDYVISADNQLYMGKRDRRNCAYTANKRIDIDINA